MSTWSTIPSSRYVTFYKDQNVTYVVDGEWETESGSGDCGQIHGSSCTIAARFLVPGDGQRPFTGERWSHVQVCTGCRHH